MKQAKVITLSFRLEVDFAPAYELLMSLDAYSVTSSHRNLDLGEAWVDQVRAALTPTFREELAALGEPLPLGALGLLIRHCPGARGPESFLTWLAGLTPGDLFELISPVGGALPADLGGARDRWVRVLTAWHEQYFSRLDPKVLDHLADAASAHRALTEAMPPVEAVDAITGGTWLEGLGPEATVLLVPQYHKRPITIIGWGQHRPVLYYPLADLPAPAGAPPDSLLRVTRALADESRLRMLHALQPGPRTFTELVQESGLTKGTVHRHIWALRFAGLVRGHVRDGVTQRYSLRPGAFDQVAAQLQRFVERRY